MGLLWGLCVHDNLAVFFLWDLAPEFFLVFPHWAFFVPVLTGAITVPFVILAHLLLPALVQQYVHALFLDYHAIR